MTAIFLTPKQPHEDAQQCWMCDDVGIVRMLQVVAERGHADLYKQEVCDSISIDAGGMLHQDDPIMSFDVGGTVFKFWAHQVAMYIGHLEKLEPAQDCPAVVIIGGRWRKTIISVPRARALVDAMKARTNEVARLTAEVDQRRAAVLEQVNKDRVRVLVVDHVENGVPGRVRGAEGFEDDSR